MMIKVGSANGYGFLSGNDHDGETIPTELGAMTGLSYGGFFFGGSQLVGTIPTQLGRMSVMISGYRLWGNTLTGPLPTELGLASDTFTSAFEARSNALTGPIPSTRDYHPPLTAYENRSANRDLPVSPLGARRHRPHSPRLVGHHTDGATS